MSDDDEESSISQLAKDSSSSSFTVSVRSYDDEELLLITLVVAAVVVAVVVTVAVTAGLVLWWAVRWRVELNSRFLPTGSDRLKKTGNILQVDPITQSNTKYSILLPSNYHWCESIEKFRILIVLQICTKNTVAEIASPNSSSIKPYFIEHPIYSTDRLIYLSDDCCCPTLRLRWLVDGNLNEGFGSVSNEFLFIFSWQSGLSSPTWSSFRIKINDKFNSNPNFKWQRIILK